MSADSTNVRFGSQAGILRCGSSLRLTLESGHWASAGTTGDNANRSPDQLALL